jgi:hypothetical protein
MTRNFTDYLACAVCKENFYLYENNVKYVNFVRWCQKLHICRLSPNLLPCKVCIQYIFTLHTYSHSTSSHCDPPFLFYL